MEPLGKRYRSLREAVADEIRSGILSGSLPPGSRLVEDDLASQLGVSRMPVREALSALEAEGFVEIVPRRGASVATLTEEEAVELFEVRSTLEGLASRLAARRATSESIGLLEAIVEDGRGAMESGRLDQMPHLHQRFHVALGEVGGNGYLNALLSPLPAKIEWVYATLIRGRAPVSWQEHAEIVEAVRSGDENLAEKVTRDHVDAAARWFVSEIRPTPDDLPEEGSAAPR